eukprot:TRINITY_DN241_c0_g1_i1.p1 TRINITY_DN241_c0_g1~~TRINITY_DN241_c0_g1_i1.p1  ORF type:complete len:841 (+),score=235.34 TRINITY_DN241_c0_g1_i1:96-2525(+)
MSRVINDDAVLMFQYINYAVLSKLKKSIEKKKLDVNVRLELDPREPTTLCAAAWPEHYTIPDDDMLKKPVTKRLREDILKFLIKKNADPDLADRRGHTPLHLALLQNNLEYVEIFVALAKKIDQFDEKGHSPLILALNCETNALHYAAAIIQRGAQVNAIGAQGAALHYAVQKNRVDYVEFLLKHGANVDLPAGLGRTPLHVAVSEKLDTVCDVLVSHGANVNVADNIKRTPLHLATLKGSNTMTKYLLSQRARVDARDRDNNCPIHYAASHGDAKMIELLLEAGASIDTAGNKGRTPLHLAVLRGHEPLVLLLLRKGAGSEVADDDGVLPLTLAVKKGFDNIVESILQRNASLVDLPEVPSKRAALHIAAGMQSEVLVRLLVSRGANVNAASATGQTPLHELLTVKGALNAAIYTFLVQKGAHINAIDSNGQTVMHLAVLRDDAALVRYLEGVGADVKSADGKGKTPLHFARSVVMVETLLALAADIESADSSGRRPLHDAAARGEEGVVMAMVEHGAQVNVEDNNWQTPRTCATSDAVRKFLQKFELQPTAVLPAKVASAAQLATAAETDSGSTGSELKRGESKRLAYHAPRMMPVVHTLLDDYHTLLNDSEFSDVTLLVESKPIYAHKAILIARCKYFRRMFSMEMKGDNKSHEFRIRVSGFRYPVFIAMLEFLYSCTVNITDGISLELLLVATKFGLEALRELTMEHIRKQLNTQNAVDMLRKAVQLKSENVKKLCVAYIAQHYHSIDDIQELTQDPDGGKLLLEIMDQAQGRRRRSESGAGTPKEKTSAATTATSDSTDNAAGD